MARPYTAPAPGLKESTVWEMTGVGRLTKPARAEQRSHNQNGDLQRRDNFRGASPQPNLAKRLECAQLAAALECSRAVECSKSPGDPAFVEGGSKLHALQTLRAVQGS